MTNIISEKIIPNKGQHREAISESTIEATAKIFGL